MPHPHPTGYSPNAGARDFEQKAGDKLLLRNAGHDLKELYDRLALELKDVESPEAEEMLVALEEHAAAMAVAGDPDN